MKTIYQEFFKYFALSVKYVTDGKIITVPGNAFFKLKINFILNGYIQCRATKKLQLSYQILYPSSY